MELFTSLACLFMAVTGYLVVSERVSKLIVEVVLL